MTSALDSPLLSARRLLAVGALLALLAAPLHAQSPNTSSMIVTVVDQTGAVVKDAKVKVVNAATGAVRESVSGEHGSATLAGLPLTGTYTVSVEMAGFAAEDVGGLSL